MKAWKGGISIALHDATLGRIRLVSAFPCFLRPDMMGIYFSMLGKTPISIDLEVVALNGLFKNSHLHNSCNDDNGMGTMLLESSKTY